MQNPVIQRIKRRAEVCQSLPVTCGRRGNDTGNGMVTVGSIQCAVDCFPENGKSPHSKPFTFLLLPAAKCRSGMFFTLREAQFRDTYHALAGCAYRNCQPHDGTQEHFHHADLRQSDRPQGGRGHETSERTDQRPENKSLRGGRTGNGRYYNGKRLNSITKIDKFV